MNRREAVEILKQYVFLDASTFTARSHAKIEAAIAYLDAHPIDAGECEKHGEPIQYCAGCDQETAHKFASEARADTYEECAQIAEDKTPYSYSPGNFMYGQSIAACIRQRAKEKVGK